MHNVLNRHEVWDADGQPAVTTLHAPPSPALVDRDQLEELLLESGLDAVATFGTDDEFIAVGDRAR